MIISMRSLNPFKKTRRSYWKQLEENMLNMNFAEK